MSTTTRPEWLVIGAKVICWTTGGAGVTPGYAVGTVTKINVKTFRVVSTRKSDEPLFPIVPDVDGEHDVRGAGRWPSHRHCVPLDSPRGRKVYADALDQVAVVKATETARRFVRFPRDRQTIAAAIRELQALQAQLDAGPAAAVVAAEEG